MTVTSPPGYLNKKQIEAAYGRSYRSLTRDITQAVRVADAKILQYLKLVTEDGKLREGTEVTLDMIQELSNSGLRPMWLAEESWVADWCAKGKRGRSDQGEAKTVVPPAAQNANLNPATSASPNQTPTVELLQERVQDLKQQNDMLLGQLQIKDEQIRSATQLADQSQQLMRDLHVLLKNVQDGLLGEGSRTLLASPTAKSKSVDTLPEQRKAEAPRPSRRKSKTGTAKRTAKTPKATDAPATKTAGRLQRWFPTLLGQKRRRT